MNQEKVREFFSAYYEGTLDPALEQTVTATLSRDAALMQEYRSFERTYEELGKLKFDVVEVPFDLHSRIMSRVDVQIEQNKKSLPAGWTIWVRNVALSGVAAAALIGAVLSLRPQAGSDVSTANPLPPVVVSSSAEEVNAIFDGRNVRLDFAPKEPRTVEIRNGIDGEVLRTVTLNGNSLNSPLENNGASTIAFAATVHEDHVTTVVAVPGSIQDEASRSGSGTLEQFVIALADTFRAPVLLQVEDPKAPVVWDLQDSDVVRAANKSLDAQSYNVMKRESGLISITSD